MSPSELRELAQEVLPLVHEAGGIAHAYFCSQELGIDTKADGSPVTQADKETEERLRLRLAALGNSFGIIGEEFGEEGADREYVWVIDPIDGTRAFTRGLPYWALLLGLLHRDQPVMGFLLAPALDVLASGWKGGGTFVNGLPVRVSTVESLGQSFVTIGSLEVLERQPWGEARPGSDERDVDLPILRRFHILPGVAARPLRCRDRTGGESVGPRRPQDPGRGGGGQVHGLAGPGHRGRRLCAGHQRPPPRRHPPMDSRRVIAPRVAADREAMARWVPR